VRVAILSKALVVASYRTKLRELSRLGIDAIGISPNGWVEEGARIPFEPWDSDENYRMEVLPMAWNGHFHLHYYPSLGRVLGVIKPDLLHVDEEPYNLATGLAFRDADRLGMPAVFFSWQNIHRNYPPPFRQIERWVYRQAAHAIAGSADARDVLRAKGYTGHLSVIPQFGVDIERFHPYPPIDRPFTVGYLGRLVPEKGMADLLSAFRRLPPPSRLVLVGDGPMGTFVDSVTADLRRDQRIQRLSRVPSSDVPDVLGQMDVVVLPSRSRPRWREQFGRVLVEAMASGVAVVGSTSGEIPNVIGDAGVIVPEGDVDALYRALERLQESPQLRQDLAVRGRERAVSTFSQARIAQRTAEVYRTALGQHQP